MIQFLSFHDWKLAFRNIRNQKRVAFLDILGLALGLSAVLLISIYVYRELSYDSFHVNCNRIFKPEFEITEAKEQIDIASNLQLATIESIRESVSGVEAITFLNYSRWDWDNGAWIEYNGHKFNLGRMAFSDKYFPAVFSFNVHEGNLSSTLDNPNQLALTRDIARKIFGDDPPIGKIVLLNNKPVTIGCILEELPSNSSLQISGLTSYKTAKYFFRNEILDWSNIPFVLTRENAEIAQVSNAISKVLYLSIPDKAREEIAPVLQTNLIPLKELYFSSGMPYDPIRHGSKKTTYVLLSIGVIILLLAIINYNNLLLATAIKREKDFGIQRVLGATPVNRRTQLFTRGIFITALAFILVVLTSRLSIVWFNKLVTYPLKYSDFLQPYAIVIGFILLGLTVLMSGILPSLFRNNKIFSPFRRTVANSPVTKNYVLKSLVVFQLVISVLLIVSAMFIVKQVNYGLKKDLGLIVNNVIILPVQKLGNKKEAFIDYVANQSQTISQCFSTSYINTFNIWGGKLDEPGEKRKSIDYNIVRANASFVPTLGLKLVEGHNFEDDGHGDENSFIVNETFVKYYNVTNPLQATIDGFPIIGVVKDFNFNSLHYTIEPMALWKTPGKVEFASVHFSAKNREGIKSFMGLLRKEWKKLRPDIPFEYEFVDERLASMYKNDIKLAKIMMSFALLSVLIACLGVTGLVYYIAKNKTKEIGIRKVNGAKVSEILTMLNKDFVKWVVIAFVIAAPIAYYAMNKWLENFAYKTNLSWWIFALAGVLALGIALLTVSWQSWRAATRNPVAALRYE